MEKNNELTEITEAILDMEDGQAQEQSNEKQVQQNMDTEPIISTGGTKWGYEASSAKEIELFKWAEEAEKIRKAKQAEEIKSGGQAEEEAAEVHVAEEPGQAYKTEEDKQTERQTEEVQGEPEKDPISLPGKEDIQQPQRKTDAEENENARVREKERKEKPAISFKERDRMITAAQEAVMLFLTIVISAVASFLYGQTVAHMAGIAILAGMGFCSTMFCISLSSENGSFLFDNEGNIWRFTITYLIFLGGSIALPVLPPGAWPYPVIFVGLMLFSNQLIGMSAGAALLLITSMIHGDMETFFIYFISGLVGIVVFSYANEVVHVWLPLMITMLAHMVCLSIQEVLFSNEPLSVELFILPGVNLIASFFLMMILLKFSALCRDWNRYMDINDPESPLLAQLKEISGEDYYHAIHTAYLCERVVKELFLDSQVVKACGYYHRIGLLKGDNSWSNIQQILKKNHFPREVRLILREYTDREKRQMIISKEAVALLFCDDVISAIRRSFSENKDTKPDCQKIINTVFIKQLESGMIDDSSITIGELQQIKKTLMEEGPYYDLLR